MRPYDLPQSKQVYLSSAMSSDEMTRGEENLAFYTVSRPVDTAHGKCNAADGKFDGFFTA